MLYLLYFFLSLVTVPCLVIVVETWIKASSDLPLLYTCRHKILVNPDKHLLRIAEQQHWQTL